MTFDAGSRNKYRGESVFVTRNHERASSPEGFVFIGRKFATEDVFSFDVREVPDVIKALQAVHDDYLEMLEDAKPKVQDVLNGLGIGAVVETAVGFKFVKTADGRWSGEFHTSVRARDFGDSMDAIEILSKGLERG